ncbi:hypothetical protein NC651_015164 [Populus alba x Populus x berolinensis]|nr:hypothetical protein NC651_015164 [Populus alba x Populus x berolinensis]
MKRQLAHLTVLSFTCLFILLQLILTVGYHQQAHDPDPSLLTLLKTALQRNPGAPFKIALFADLHFGEAASD